MRPKDADLLWATRRVSLRGRFPAHSAAGLSQSLRRLALVMVSLTGSLGVGASETQDERWYQVEVIVFKRLNAPLSAPSSGALSPKFPQPLFAVSPHEMQAAKPMLIEQALYLDESAGSTGLSEDLPSADPATRAATTTFKFARFAEGPRYRALVQAHAEQRLQALQQDNVTPVEQTLVDPQTLAIQAVLAQESFAFRAVADADRNLAGAARSIRRSKDYRMLLHDSWTQPIDAQSTAILLQGGDQFGDQFELEGTLSVRRTRFLHVETDLWLTRFEATGSLADPFQDHPIAKIYPALILAAARGQSHEPSYRYHLAQQRRLRSNEVHYLDHPQFGVIIEIRPAAAARAL